MGSKRNLAPVYLVVVFILTVGMITGAHLLPLIK